MEFLGDSEWGEKFHVRGLVARSEMSEFEMTVRVKCSLVGTVVQMFRWRCG